MKRLYFIFCLFIFTGCNRQPKAPADSTLPVLDLTKDYPEIEVDIHEIADVEYVPLETTDESLMIAGVEYCISDKYIITYDPPGTVFFFDRTGKHIRTICNIGQGPKEHFSIFSFAVDFNREEYYIEDRSKLHVYSFLGEWKRSFNLPKGIHHNDMIDYDENHLIIDNKFHESFFNENQPADKTPYYLVNKETGAYTPLTLTIEKRISRVLKRGIESIDENTSDTYIHDLYMITPILANSYDILIADFGLDTLYNLKNGEFTPIAVRYPPVHSNNPPTVIAPTHYSNQLMFFKPVKMIYTPKDIWEPYDSAPLLMWDRKNNEIHSVRLYDSNQPERDIMHTMKKRWLNEPNTFLNPLRAERLFKALQDGKLNGKLKEISSLLKEDDNNVLAIYKLRKFN